MGVCLWADSILVSICVILIMWQNTVWRGGLPASVFVNLLGVPLSFLAIGALTVAVTVAHDQSSFLFSLHLCGLYIGISQEGILTAGRLFFKSLGSVSCMYYLSLNTPIIDLLAALRRLKIPKLIIELMGLIYRYIFVLLDSANRIFTAQNSRSGYSNLSSAYRSLGTLVSKLFINAYKRSDDLYTALEARGYDGELNVLEEPFKKCWAGYVKSICINMLLVSFTLLIRFLKKEYFHG